MIFLSKAMRHLRAISSQGLPSPAAPLPSMAADQRVCRSPSSHHPHLASHFENLLNNKGDARFAKVLEKMGADVVFGPNSITVSRRPDVPLVGVDEDCGDIPDVAMTLAVVGLFAKASSLRHNIPVLPKLKLYSQQGRTAIRNVYNWRVKETERMVAMVTELQKLGATVEEGRDFLIVDGLAEGQRIRSQVEIETYDDHRVAMW